MHLALPLVTGALLFGIGTYGLLARRNAVLVLMSVELMLNAVNVLLVAFDVWRRDQLHAGQSATLIFIALAAGEVGVGLAIVLQLFRLRSRIAVDARSELAEPYRDTLRPAPPTPPSPPATSAPPAGERDPDPVR